MTTGRRYMLLNFSGIEIATGVYLYISRTMLILPLGTCIEFIISGTVLLLPLSACKETACGFIFLETVLILPLGETYVSRL